MAKVSRAYIKSAGQDQSGSIQAGSTIYAQDILDLIDSAKWHDEGIENVYYDDTSNGIKVVKSSDPGNPVFIPIPKNSDIVNKLVKGTDKYELRSDNGLVAETDLPSTLVTSVACDKDANELQVSSTSSDSGITVPLPDSLKSAAIEGHAITFNSLDGNKKVIDLPDSLKSVYIEGNDIKFISLHDKYSEVRLPSSFNGVSIDGNTLTLTRTDGMPSVINLPVTSGYLSDVSLSDGTLVFTKDGSSDVRVTLPFVSKAITGVDLQGSNLVFTFSDNTSATITLPTQSEGGTTAGLLSGVRIDSNKLIFTVSGGNDITIELPSTSGDVDLTGLLYNPSYSSGRLSFKVKGSNDVASVDIDGVAQINGLFGDELVCENFDSSTSRISLRRLTEGVLTGASLSGDNLVFTAKDSDNVSVPLSNLTADGVITDAEVIGDDLVFIAKGGGNTTISLNNLVASGVLTGVSLSDGNLVFTVKGGDNISIPLSSSSSGVQDVNFRYDDGSLNVTKSDGSRTSYTVLPRYTVSAYTDHKNFGWGGSLGCYNYYSGFVDSYAPLWVPTNLSYMDSVLKSSVSLTNKEQLSLSGTTNIEMGTIHGSYYHPPYGNTTDTLDFMYCSLPFEPSLSESSGTFTANVITRTDRNFDYVLMFSYNLNVSLNGNIFEALPSEDYTTVVHLLQKSRSLSRFRGFAYVVGDFVILIDKYMFFAKQVFDWSYNVTNSFGMRFYFSSNIEKYSAFPFTATAGKVLE